MSLRQRVSSDHELARLLQIGIVLEEVNEARARRHRDSIGETDETLSTLLAEASEESAEHRQRLETLLKELEATPIPPDEIDTLVGDHYAASRPEDFDDVLYDQLCSEESAYKFYDDLIDAIEDSETVFSADRERILERLRSIREQEERGVEAVLELMESES